MHIISGLQAQQLKMEGMHYVYKVEEKKRNMHKHYAKHIEINSDFMLK